MFFVEVRILGDLLGFSPVSSSHYDGLLIIFADQFPLDSSSVDVVLAISRTSDFPSEKICSEFSRILKPGGTVFVCKNLEGETGDMQQVCVVYLVYV